MPWTSGFPLAHFVSHTGCTAKITHWLSWQRQGFWRPYLRAQGQRRSTTALRHHPKTEYSWIFLKHEDLFLFTSSIWSFYNTNLTVDWKKLCQAQCITCTLKVHLLSDYNNVFLKHRMNTLVLLKLNRLNFLQTYNSDNCPWTLLTLMPCHGINLHGFVSSVFFFLFS